MDAPAAPAAYRYLRSSRRSERLDSSSNGEDVVVHIRVTVRHDESVDVC